MYSIQQSRMTWIQTPHDEPSVWYFSLTEMSLKSPRDQRRHNAGSRCSAHRKLASKPFKVVHSGLRPACNALMPVDALNRER
jgi:hypothetical protein